MKLVCAAAFGITLASFAACSDEAGSKATTNSLDGGTDAAAAFNAGEELRVPVNGRVYAKLASPPAVVAQTDAWDLAFDGLDVFTNSGPSGAGKASAFGPVDAIAFLEDTAPQVPFTTADKTGGAFIHWYLYNGQEHALYSRYHVFGVKDGDKLYRVQILGYYGTRNGAEVPALYHVRWSAVGQPAQDANDIDGTAGGASSDDPSVASQCLDLGIGARSMLTPADARTSSAWHLCFRRENISVNGALGGPRNVTAVDLDSALAVDETLDVVTQRTPESEQGRFDAVTAASFDGQDLRGDGVVSAFSGLWLEHGASPPAPTKYAWLVIGNDGAKNYLVGFPSFDGATATSAGTVVMRVKAVH